MKIMKIASNIILGVSLLLFVGCYSTGLSPREVGGLTYSDLVYGLNSGKSEAKIPPKMTYPIKLAVAQVGEISPPEQLLKELRSYPELISEVIEVPLPGENPNQGYYNRNNDEAGKRQDVFHERVNTMLTLSKQLGAEKVLMIGGHIDSRTISSPFEILDIAIVPAFILPSKKVKIDAKASGALIDVNSGAVVFIVSTTSSDSGITPSAYVGQKCESLSIAQLSVLSKQMADKFVEQLRKNK